MVGRVGYIARRSWSTLRQSRLGLIGFIIVVIFAFIAILAPVIAPYPRTFQAPDADRFSINAFSRSLPSNLTYATPVVGPTTPLFNAAGSTWDINYNASRGFVYMDLMHYQLSLNVTPFQAANQSLSFNVATDYKLPFIPGLPIHSLYYIVPAIGYTDHTTGAKDRNGALGIFTGQDFLAVDPFNRSVFFTDQLPFTPTWTGEDPASAGKMLIAPAQYAFSIGPVAYPVGPYEYFWASNGNQTRVYELTYVHANSTFTPSGHIAVYDNDTLSAPPFVYYNQFKTTAGGQFRTGPGQGVFLPLTNDTLKVLDVSGTPRAWIPLTLAGSPALVTGDIGYVQSSYPEQLYLPLRSATAAGIAYLDLSAMKITHEFVLSGSSWQPVGLPVSRTGTTLHTAFYSPANDTTFFVGLNETAGVVPQFQVDFHGQVRDYFYVAETNLLFFFGANGRLYTLPTTFGLGSATVVPDQFAVVPGPSVRDVLYAGSFAGTMYGSLSTTELNGIFTDPSTGKTVAFQLVGTIQTPLPPGTYPSGNTYLWGTDFFGGDILTEWIYGTQIAFVVGLLAALFSVGIGTLVGVISGYYGKLLDTLLMRTTDVFLVLPFLAIVLVLISIVSPSIWVIIMVIAILGWPGIARVIRAQVLSLKERPFVDAARVSGASDLRLIFLHIAPNVLPFSFLYMSLSVGGAIITEAALSFLGFGDPSVTSWGGMLSNLLTFSGSLHAWWWLLPPGLGITFLSLGFYLIGRGFDEIINPRLRRR